ncbi:UNVERIFIED_CONTAM: hypothetical protein NCL1_41471 [Trichonephila clavipes]
MCVYLSQKAHFDPFFNMFIKGEKDISNSAKLKIVEKEKLAAMSHFSHHLIVWCDVQFLQCGCKIVANIAELQFQNLLLMLTRCLKLLKIFQLASIH